MCGRVGAECPFAAENIPFYRDPVFSFSGTGSGCIGRSGYDGDFILPAKFSLLFVFFSGFSSAGTQRK